MYFFILKTIRSIIIKSCFLFSVQRRMCCWPVSAKGKVLVDHYYQEVSLVPTVNTHILVNPSLDKVAKFIQALENCIFLMIFIKDMS